MSRQDWHLAIGTSALMLAWVVADLIMTGAIQRGQAVAIVEIPAAPAGWISQAEALGILTGKGDYSEAQALIILGHSLQRSINGATHYPRAYIEQRAS